MLVDTASSLFFFNDTATTEIYTLSYTTLFRSASFRRFTWQSRESGSCSRVLGLQTCALPIRSEEHTSELQSHLNLVCRLLLEKKNLHDDTHHLKSAQSEIREQRFLDRCLTYAC